MVGGPLLFAFLMPLVEGGNWAGIILSGKRTDTEKENDAKKMQK